MASDDRFRLPDLPAAREEMAKWKYVGVASRDGGMTRYAMCNCRTENGNFGAFFPYNSPYSPNPVQLDWVNIILRDGKTVFAAYAGRCSFCGTIMWMDGPDNP
jgi:hypothetical protein